VDDFVNLMDLAPTLLEIAGLTPPEVMTGKSILPLLLSDKSGQIDPSRDFVVTGRERHVEKARADLTPYPQRAFRTKDFLYIRNFHPERYPMGDPYHKAETLNLQQLADSTHYTFADMDSSPTKTWLVQNGEKPEWQKYWNYAFAKRPAEELYDLRTDPDYLDNVADKPEYADVRKNLSDRLLSVLTSTRDPRITEDGKQFENPPFAGPGTEERSNNR
jgi:arylsulfatase A-like enzyme